MAVWALVGVLVAGVVTLVALMATGRLTLDTGWGRTRHRLGPIVVDIAAPPELVFEVIAAPYLGRAGAQSHVEVWERGTDLVVAAHRTPVHGYVAVTVEAVGFEPPHRVRFRHLRGPVPYAAEAFELEPVADPGGVVSTRLTYDGEVGLDWWVVGWLAARWWVVPVWRARVGEALARIRGRAEARAAAQRRRRQR